MTHSDHTALGGLAALAHSSEGVSALGISNGTSANSNPNRRLILTKQSSVAQEVAVNSAGATRQVYVAVKGTPFQLQLQFLDDTFNTSNIALEYSLIFDTENPSEIREVRMLKEPKPVECDIHRENQFINIAARVRVLSSQMEDMLFRIRFVATLGTQDATPLAVCDSNPIKVVSKVKSTGGSNSSTKSPNSGSAPPPKRSRSTSSAGSRASSVGDLSQRSASAISTIGSMPSRTSSILGLAAVAAAADNPVPEIRAIADRLRADHQILDDVLRQMHQTNQTLARSIFNPQTPVAASPSPLGSSLLSSLFPLNSSAAGTGGVPATMNSSGGQATNPEDSFDKQFTEFLNAFESSPNREDALSKALEALTAAECDQLLQLIESIGPEEGGISPQD